MKIKQKQHKHKKERSRVIFFLGRRVVYIYIVGEGGSRYGSSLLGYASVILVEVVLETETARDAMSSHLR